MPKRHRAPSRIRYEENNPTFSARIPKVLYEQLRKLCREGDWSFADFVRQALKAQRPVVKEVKSKLKAEYEQGYEQGYQRGYGEATDKYRVIFPCAVCKKPIEITTDKEKAAAAQGMATWRHVTCT
jgi:flagellar biosynthesis/type III secretory pathway protein FliH